jgi:hypothetical protein
MPAVLDRTAQEVACRASAGTASGGCVLARAPGSGVETR